MDSLSHVFAADKPVPAHDRRHLEELAAILDRLDDWCTLERRAGRSIPRSVEDAVFELTVVYRSRVGSSVPGSLAAALAEFARPLDLERRPA